MNEMPEVANVPIATQNSSDVDALGTGAATPGADGATTEQTNLTTALSAIAASRYYYMVFSVEDATKLGVIQTHIATKSQPIPGLRSVGIAASPLALATVQTLANGRNYERLQIVWQKNSEATREVLAANMAAIRQKYEQLDSAYNFDFYSNKGDWLIPACYRDADRPSGDDQNDAITDGITVVATNDSSSYIVMSCTTRSKDSTGNQDDFRATETHRISVADEFVDTLLLRHSLNYANKKLASDELLPDGTVSFALYGTLEEPGDTRGFRVTFAEGDNLYFSLLIPDLAPENALADDQLPRLDIVDPSGVSTTILPTTRVPFPEPFTGTNYVRLADSVGIAVAGTYEVTISGDAPARFTVSVGTKELFGTEVENAPNRDLGVGGVMTWYETPPPVVETSTTTASPTTLSPSSDTEAPMTSEVEARTTSAGADEGAESDGGSSLPIVIAIVVGVGLIGTVIARRRSRR